MPPTGPGVGQYISTAPAPTWIFTAPANVKSANVRVWNSGTAVAYVGQAGTTWQTGFPIPPGSKPVEIQNVGTTLYAVANVVPGSNAQTVNTTSGTVGSTTFTVSSNNVAWVPGSTVVIGNGPNREAFVVSGTGATTMTVSTASIYAHPTGDTVTTATLYPTSLVVNAGVF